MHTLTLIYCELIYMCLISVNITFPGLTRVSEKFGVFLWRGRKAYPVAQNLTL